MITLTCQHCGSDFQTYSAWAKRGGKFCSLLCGNQAKAAARRGTGTRRRVLSNGYVYVRTDDGREVYEHRAVMERALGRKLARREHVHHLNGDRTDNRLENLELIEASEHNRRHNLGRKKGAYRTHRGRPLDPAGEPGRRQRREYMRRWRARKAK